jgi:hypothetical protein
MEYLTERVSDTVRKWDGDSHSRSFKELTHPAWGR